MPSAETTTAPAAEEKPADKPAETAPAANEATDAADVADTDGPADDVEEAETSADSQTSGTITADSDPDTDVSWIPALLATLSGASGLGWVARKKRH